MTVSSYGNVQVLKVCVIEFNGQRRPTFKFQDAPYGYCRASSSYECGSIAGGGGDTTGGYDLLDDADGGILFDSLGQRFDGAVRQARVTNT